MMAWHMGGDIVAIRISMIKGPDSLAIRPAFHCN